MWGFTKIQQRAMVFLLASFGAGCVILYYRRQQPPPPVAPALAAQFQIFSRQLEPDTARVDSVPQVRGLTAPSAIPAAARKRININTATPAELIALPGIGAAMAQRLVAYREQNGKFRRWEDLAKVKGIGKRKLEALKDWVVLQ